MTTKTTKNKSKTITPMSVQEFKMWIKGLSEFQDDNWSPNKSQWEHIRSLIDGLNDNGPSVVPQRTQPQQMRQPVAPMGETVVLADNQNQHVAPPVQQRFLGGHGRASGSTGELDESGHAILKPVSQTGSDFV